MDAQEEMMYQENILEHARNPQNKNEIFLSLHERESFEKYGNIKILKEKGDNPSCGDSGTLFLKIKKIETVNDFIILEASFIGNGCAISQASFDMMCIDLKGKTLSEIKLWTPAKIYELIKIQITPSRVNCALLPYRALEKTLKNV